MYLDIFECIFMLYFNVFVIYFNAFIICSNIFQCV
jgi:hypothetical protein